MVSVVTVGYSSLTIEKVIFDFINQIMNKQLIFEIIILMYIFTDKESVKKFALRI